MIQHIKAVWHFRYFWYSLVQLDLRNRYRRSVLGLGWSMLHPLAMTAVFCIAFGGIIGKNDWREYAPYLLAGLSIWDFFKGSLIQCCDAFYRGESYIRQCPLPLTVYTLRVVIGQFVHFMIALGLCAIGTCILKQTFDPIFAIPKLVPAIVILTVFTWSMGTIAAFANAYFHDTKHLIEVVTGLLFFLTPIMFYPKELIDRVGSWIVEMNPIAHFIHMVTEPLLHGRSVEMQFYVTAMLLSAICFGLACATISWLQKRLIFQL